MTLSFRIHFHAEVFVFEMDCLRSLKLIVSLPYHFQGAQRSQRHPLDLNLTFKSTKSSYVTTCSVLPQTWRGTVPLLQTFCDQRARFLSGSLNKWDFFSSNSVTKISIKSWKQVVLKKYFVEQIISFQKSCATD